MTTMKTKGLEEIKSLLGSDKLIIGADVTTKALKKGKLETVYMASNTRADIARDLENYGKISGVEVIKLTLSNNELGTACKKPYSISVIGVMRE